MSREKQPKIRIMQNTLKYLCIQFIWPNIGEELNPPRSFYLKYFLLMVSTSTMFIGTLLHLFVALKDNIDVDVSLDLAYLLSNCGVFYYMSNHVISVPNTAKLFAELSDFKTFGKPLDFEQRNNRYNKASKALFIFMILCLGGVTVLPIIDIKDCEKLNQLKNLNENCGLQQPTWTPFDANPWHWRLLLLLLQFYSTQMSTRAAGFLNYTLMEGVEHIAIRVDHVKYLFQQAINTENAILRRQLFNKCVEYHIIIFGWAEAYDRSYRRSNFTHLMLSGVVMGLLLYQLLGGAALGPLCLLQAWFVCVIIVNLAGQNLTDKCLSITDAIQDTNWYLCDKSIINDLSFVIMRCQKPIFLNAGPFGHLSYAVIIAIIKTSYSYLTLLTKTMD